MRNITWVCYNQVLPILYNQYISEISIVQSKLWTSVTNSFDKSEKYRSIKDLSHSFDNLLGGKEAFGEEYKRLFETDFFDNTSIGGDKIVDMICQMFETSVFIIEKTGTPELAEKMVSYQKVMNSEVKDILRSKSDMSYIVHGDAWYNNFLFR